MCTIGSGSFVVVVVVVVHLFHVLPHANVTSNYISAGHLSCYASEKARGYTRGLNYTYAGKKLCRVCHNRDSVAAS